MRVIAGSAKGCILTSVPGPDTRPITDRVKKALFDILEPSIIGTRVLDLFAGTGSVGIEALSRGAAHTTFVERDRRAVLTIQENLSRTSLASRATVIREDVFRFLTRSAEQAFHIVYIAPPQYHGLWIRTLEILDKTSLLHADGLAIVQIFPKEYTPLELTSLRLVDQRRYGSTLLCFYRSGPTVNQDSTSQSPGVVVLSSPTTRNCRVSYETGMEEKAGQPGIGCP